MATTHSASHHRSPKLPSEVRLDATGRLSLGKVLGGRLFKVVAVGEEIRLIPARVVPDSEAWFFEKRERVAAMDRSIAQADADDLAEVSAEGIADL